MIRRILISLLIIILAQATYLFMKDFNAQYPTNDYWGSACKAVSLSSYKRGDAPIECMRRYEQGLIIN